MVTEWGVVGVLTALVGLIITVLMPVVRLNTSITRLNVKMDEITDDLKTLIARNADGHRRLWEQNARQDAQLNNHEGRIKRLEEQE